MTSFLGARPERLTASGGRNGAEPPPGAHTATATRDASFDAAAAGAAPKVGKLVRGLGYFSLGLGTTQMLAPGLVDRVIGVREDSTSRRWERFVGVQELSAAAGILSRPRPTEWLWGRTSADVLHLTMLVRAYRNRRDSGARLAFAIASVVGCFIADGFASVRMTADPKLTQEGQTMKGQASITIRASREQLAARWRSFEQQAGSGARLGPLEILSEGSSSIEWRTADGASEQARGVTRFSDAPGARGSEIHVSVEFDVPGGPVGSAVKKIAGDEPLQLVRDDLRRLKQLIETGEIVRSEGAPTGSNAESQPKQHPARPLEHAQL